MLLMLLDVCGLQPKNFMLRSDHNHPTEHSFQ